MLVEQRLANEKKSAATAYLLWFFLGGFSAHRFYLGRTGSAIAQLVLIWGGIFLLAVVVGIPMLVVAGIWLLVDVFLIGGMIDQDMSSKRARIVNEVSLTSGSES
ncbi:MAG: TM2 domain-containing protein [Alphaproteobacteria bacterium]|nr:TM2 domain-containing protein [Alphaproteobacteria bacterium]